MELPLRLFLDFRVIALNPQRSLKGDFVST
jgi:hypothetical protein